MNQVQQLRQHFEQLKIPEKNFIESEKLQKIEKNQNPNPKNPKPFLGLFKRSKTSIEITRNCDKNANHDIIDDKSALKCIKRSPAFRFNQDRTRASIHSHPSAKSVEKKIKTFENLQDEVAYVNRSETIKKALLKPLPIGRPPPKPPRMFNSNSPNGENGRKSSISSTSSSSTPNKDEVIYMEPFAHLKQSPKPKMEPEPLHYMCTDLDTGRSQVNNRKSSLQAAHDSIEKNSIEKVRKRNKLPSRKRLQRFTTHHSYTLYFRSTCFSTLFMTRSDVKR